MALSQICDDTVVLVYLSIIGPPPLTRPYASWRRSHIRSSALSPTTHQRGYSVNGYKMKEQMNEEMSDKGYILTDLLWGNMKKDKC